jgi:hypothetical protein
MMMPCFLIVSRSLDSDDDRGRLLTLVRSCQAPEILGLDLTRLGVLRLRLRPYLSGGQTRVGGLRRFLIVKA